MPHSNLGILDPIWTTQYMARNHGYMIYDTLFGTDEKNQVKPQMVEKWTVSPDHRLWTFTLRPGLEFHDGKPVTGEDVIASLAALGQARRDGAEADDLRRAHGLAGARHLPHLPARGVRLRARGARQAVVERAVHHAQARRRDPADKQIEEHIGSGPYVFKRDEFKPGDKAVYLKNAKYVPRKEPPSGTTGGKNVYVDRVEWNLALRDAQAQVNALPTGEVDILERRRSRATSSCKGRRRPDPKYSNLRLQYMGASTTCTSRSTTPRCARRRSRRFAQEPFLRAQVGVKEFYKSCASMFTCGTPYGTRQGSEIQSKSNMKKAQELLKASGYDGTPIVMMKPTDLAAIQKLPDVAAQLLRQAGFKVDLQAMDWNTVVGRRAKKDRRQGRLEHLPHRLARARRLEPARQRRARHRAARSRWFGWPSDDRSRSCATSSRARPTTRRRRRSPSRSRCARSRSAPMRRSASTTSRWRRARTSAGFLVSNGDIYWNLKKN